MILQPAKLLHFRFSAKKFKPLENIDIDLIIKNDTSDLMLIIRIFECVLWHFANLLQFFLAPAILKFNFQKSQAVQGKMLRVK